MTTTPEAEATMADEAMVMAGIYVASRASLPERSAMWRKLRAEGWGITSSWIDEAGEGDTDDFTELWDRIMREITGSDKLVLYAEQDDFPLKGALIETGIALGMGKQIVVCLPGVVLDGRTHRPIGSWLAHRNVTRIDCLIDAMKYAVLSRPAPAAEVTGELCTYGPPAERKRHWILKFEDSEMGDMHFDCEAEAIAMFYRCTSNWNCTLLATVGTSYALEDGSIPATKLADKIIAAARSKLAASPTHDEVKS